MKKILLIAKFNDMSKQLYNMLSTGFDVRLGSDKIYVILGILEIEKPDFILISINGFDSWHHNIFIKINEEYPDIPVLCYGTASEQEPFKMHTDTPIFHSMEPTADSTALTSAIHDILNGTAAASADSSPAAGQTANAPLKETVRDGNDKKTILLVDDDPVQLRAVRALLQDKYKVLMTTSGTEALILLGRQLPDLIFLDYNMPVCDGRQTLKMIREFEPAKNIPVIFLTGIGDKAHIEMVLKLNPAGYILKPVKQETLFEIIADVLG